MNNAMTTCAWKLIQGDLPTSKETEPLPQNP